MRTLRYVAATCFGVVLLFLVLSYAFLSAEGLSARKKPGKLEYAVANCAMGLSIPADAKKLKNPLTADAQALAEARKEYAEHCAVCHAGDGAGKTALATGLSPAVPDLHAEHTQKLADGEIFYIIKNGVRFTGMPAWDLKDNDIWSLVSLIREFPKEAPSAEGSK